MRGIVGLIAVSAPPLLDLAGLAVNHRDASISVAVGHVALVGLRIDVDLGNTPEIHWVIAAFVLALMARLRQELAVHGKLQDLRIFGAVAAKPDIVLVVDKNAVHRLGPLITLAGTAPRFDDVA